MDRFGLVFDVCWLSVWRKKKIFSVFLYINKRFSCCSASRSAQPVNKFHILNPVNWSRLGEVQETIKGNLDESMSAQTGTFTMKAKRVD